MTLLIVGIELTRIYKVFSGNRSGANPLSFINTKYAINMFNNKQQTMTKKENDIFPNNMVL